MPHLFDIPPEVILSQLLVGLINGSFYAMLSMGIAIIFGLLNLINFVHGAQYMLGAFVAWMLLSYAGIGYWWALVIAPLTVGTIGVLIERTLLARLYKVDHIYGLLLTLGLTLVIEGVLRDRYGVSGLPYSAPKELAGAFDIGFMHLPIYRAWVVLVSLVTCVGAWLAIEKTRLGAYLRAATENAAIVETFGINVPLMLTLTYGFGVALAGLAGVVAAPLYSVSPDMGSDLIITVFAVVVVGGMGSIFGSIVTGFGLGLIEGLTKVVYPEASSTVVFIVMALVLFVKPSGLFGRKIAPLASREPEDGSPTQIDLGLARFAVYATLTLVLIAAPYFVYPVFVMQVMCAALFAGSFILLLGYGGLLSFGHAAFFGMGSYITAHAAKAWGLSPELAILAGVTTAVGLGVVFGSVAIRRQGIYFAMITLALSQMVYFLCLQMPFTGGEDGIRAVPRGKLFGWIDIQSEAQLYWLVAALFLGGMLVIYRVVHSPFGHVLKAVRDNEPRATSLGYRTVRYRFAVFVISSGLAGLAGSMKALVFQFASLSDVHWTASVDVVLMALIGGVGSLWGAVVGALVLVSMHSLLAQLGAWVTVIHGVVFMLCVLMFRNGLVGLAARYLSIRRRAASDPNLSPVGKSA